MSRQRLTLITITCNNAAGLERTLASVAAQTRLPDQHIIVDGLSTDSTAEILARYADRCQVVRVPAHGVYDALNHGLDAADGDIIGMLHAGDVFASDDILERVCDVFAADDAPDFIFGDVHFASNSGMVTRYYSAREFKPSRMIDGFTPPHPSLYMTRRTLDLVGRYKETYSSAGDFEMFLRLFNNPNLAWRYVPLDMVLMARGGLSSRFKYRLYTNNHERLAALKAHGYPASYLRILKHYLNVLKSYLCRPTKK